MPYGSLSGVAALSSQWTKGGEFTNLSKPTAAQVTTWLENVSATIDTALSDQGFVTPVTVPAVVLELDLLTNGIVKDLADFSHGAGRFFTERYIDRGISPFMAIDKELHDWVKRKVVGLELQGVPKVEGGRNIASFKVY